MEYEAKLIKMNQLGPGMILIEPILDKDNQILFPEGTKFDEVDYSLLIFHGVRNIFIRADTYVEVKQEIDDPQRAKNLQALKVKTSDRPEFISFSKNYSEKSKNTKAILHNISGGHNIDISQLTEMMDDLMSDMKFRSDVLGFMYEVKANNDHTYAHCTNVGLLCNIFGNWLNYGEVELAMLTAAGLLHDIGKVKIPNEILEKKEKLTEDEFILIKTHPVQGYRILKEQPDIPEDVALAALMHHERIDGSGYPLKAKTEQINSYAKIVGICDIFEAMTANRAYRDKISPFSVIKEFETNFFGVLDTAFLLVFLKNIAYNYVGNWVLLDDGREAEVIFINDKQLSRPMVRDERGDIVDLATSKHLNILSLV